MSDVRDAILKAMAALGEAAEALVEKEDEKEEEEGEAMRLPPDTFAGALRRRG